MYIVPIAWIYVALMMAIAEANHANGTLLGAIITFFLYGIGPVALVLYVMGTPARRRAIKAQEAAEMAERAKLKTPDTSGHAPTDAVPPVGEKL